MSRFFFVRFITETAILFLLLSVINNSRNRKRCFGKVRKEEKFFGTKIEIVDLPNFAYEAFHLK